MNYEEYQEIGVSLSGYYGVFKQFWEMVTPRFTDNKDECPTAQVMFNKENQCVDFAINRHFWNKCSVEKRKFIICHECLHVLLKHGDRASSLLARLNAQSANAALDIPINEMLVRYFGFSRKKVDPKNELCWADTVFPNANEPTNRSFEYYFGKMKDNSKNLSGLQFSDHSYLVDLNDPSAQQFIKDYLDSLSKESGDMFKEMAERDGGTKEVTKTIGSESGNLIQYAKTEKVLPKKKWKTVIKKWALKFTKKEREQYHWLVKERRTSLLSYDGMFFPNEMEYEVRKNTGEKIDIWLFQDTSGSCIHLKDRFFKAFESLPKDAFDVKMHCFDTHVYPLTDKDIKIKKLYGFGGTSFQAIEDYVQMQIKKEGKKFPVVFVLTDGFAYQFRTTNPKQWYFFLSENHKNSIPKGAHSFMLEDFE